MKQLLTLLIANLMLISLPATAPARPSSQPQGAQLEHNGVQQARADELRKQCIAYVTKECELRTEEGKFLETELTRYDQKKMVLWRERAELLDKLSEGDLSDYSYGQTLDRVLQIDIELRECRKVFYQSLQPRFGNKKTSLIYLSMRHFKRDFSRTKHGK